MVKPIGVCSDSLTMALMFLSILNPTVNLGMFKRFGFFGVFGAE